jgi:hypothetical protein
MKQKAFAKPGFGLSGQAEAQMIRGFLLVFSKKEGLPLPVLPFRLEQGGTCCVLLATNQGTGHA